MSGQAQITSVEALEAFRAKLLNLQINSVHLDVTSETVEFLGDWLIDHALTSDKEFVPYLKKPR